MRVPAVADGTKVSMSGHELVFGQNIFTPRDANGILHDEAALHARIEEDGYLLIRGFYDREAVLSARIDILKQLSEQGRLAKDVPYGERHSWAGRRQRRPFHTTMSSRCPTTCASSIRKPHHGLL